MLVQKDLLSHKMETMEVKLWESVMGANVTGSFLTHHINPDTGGRSSVWNTDSNCIHIWFSYKTALCCRFESFKS
jgi:hypothetical protein